ncbi:ketopantoate reductase family protein [Paenibacillus psychroresistens]|uniref:ketopantoate reductase family protein n=1 Tax=Paenibacillus psychroresistens TaxID=1778678 RepID=UPI001D04C46A|nr:2-dehydropantoate 2-reductase [Paenibacillus psychroresistens]
MKKRENEVHPVRIRIVGAGALGLLFASKIAATAAIVDLITHTQEQSDLLTAKGILAVSSQEEIVYSVDAFSMHTITGAAELLEPVDWLFLMVKQKDITAALLQQLLLLVTPTTRIVCFQNGIGHMELLKQHFSNDRLYAAITTEGALKLSAASFRHSGHGTTWIGRLENMSSDSVEWDEAEIILQTMLIEAGFNVFLSKKIISNIWNKLLINAVINPLTAILQIKNGALLESLYIKDLMSVLFEEGCLVARAANITIADNLWEQLIHVCEKTAENQSSMLKDILEGRTTEIDWINGALIQYANQYKLALPTHQAFYKMIKHLESR